MIIKKEITKEQILQTIKNGEFSDEIKKSAEKVVILMSQDWCPQWKSMSNFIFDISAQEEVHVYVVLYNTQDYYREFRNFKENVFDNLEIPYLRFYKNGVLYNHTNYIDKFEYEEILNI